MKILLIVAVLFMSGCASGLKPWERGILAKEHMALDPDSQLMALRLHAQFSKEGASGGYGGGAGGCGCN